MVESTESVVNITTNNAENAVVTTQTPQKNFVTDAMKVSAEDKGHRLGNFHNYYTFHPPSSRIEALEKIGIFKHVLENWSNSRDNKNEIIPSKRQKTDTEMGSKDKHKVTFKYCDLGCNEGDLSIGVAKRILLEHNNTKDQSNHVLMIMKCLGLDVDPTLIERANNKSANDESVESEFKECNLCDAKDHDAKYSPVFASEQVNETKEKFDFTTVFSTTMWIHVHAGDDGLREFLKRTCKRTNMLLVEPQSSKW